MAKFNKDISTQVNNDSDLLYPKSKQDYYEQEPSKQQIVFCENRFLFYCRQFGYAPEKLFSD